MEQGRERQAELPERLKRKKNVFVNKEFVTIVLFPPSPFTVCVCVFVQEIYYVTDVIKTINSSLAKLDQRGFKVFQVFR